MKIQLSEKRIIDDAITVWSHPGPDVDIVMDLKSLTFRPESITEIFAFHVLDNLYPEEVEESIKNWHSILKTGSELHLINDDFEYISRAYIAGDIDIEMFNNLHNHPYQCSRESLLKLLNKSGFSNNETIVIWHEGGPSKVEKKHYEIVLSAKK